jgi:hypothetical protein
LTKSHKEEIPMNDPLKFNDELTDATQADALTEHAADEITEVDSDLLEQVAGGGGGTAVGYS